MELTVKLFEKRHKPDIISITSKVRNLNDISEQDLVEGVRTLVNSNQWKYLEEKLWRLRDIRSAESLLTSDMHEVGKMKGWIKALDWVLQLSNNKL
jgi:hypothetical protein